MAADQPNAPLARWAAAQPMLEGPGGRGLPCYGIRFAYRRSRCACVLGRDQCPARLHIMHSWRLLLPSPLQAIHGNLVSLHSLLACLDGLWAAHTSSSSIMHAMKTVG